MIRRMLDVVLLGLSTFFFFTSVMLLQIIHLYIASDLMLFKNYMSRHKGVESYSETYEFNRTRWNRCTHLNKGFSEFLENAYYKSTWISRFSNTRINISLNSFYQRLVDVSISAIS